MSGKRNAKLLQAVLATAPVVLMFSNTARGTGTWIGSVSSSWGDAANWGGTGNPPGVTANNGDAYIGNNSTVVFGGYVTPTLTQANVTRLRVGFGGPGTNNPGTGTLIVDTGTLNLDQDSSVGDGNAGTIIVNGGNLIQRDTKHIVLGYNADAYLKVTAGQLFDHSKYGIEQGSGFSTVELSGGSIVFDKADNATQINV